MEPAQWGKHLLGKWHIAKLHGLTQSEVSELTCTTVDETSFATLKRQQWMKSSSMFAKQIHI
jgi:hypothetical protein